MPSKNKQGLKQWNRMDSEASGLLNDQARRQMLR